MHRLKVTRLYMAANRPNAPSRPIRGLDRRAIFQHGQQRQHETLGKIGVLEQASRVADRIAKLERDRLTMGIYSLAAGGLQRAQQSIAPQIMVRLHLWPRLYIVPVPLPA